MAKQKRQHLPKVLTLVSGTVRQRNQEDTAPALVSVLLAGFSLSCNLSSCDRFIYLGQIISMSDILKSTSRQQFLLKFEAFLEFAEWTQCTYIVRITKVL